MSERINNDNIYKIGSFITAKDNPSRKLVIRQYYQRIYYCSVVDSPALKDLAYFERELIHPG
jgi:hypothetical protein